MLRLSHRQNPWAWGFGWARGIPWGWRLIDCSFGLGGLVPLLLVRRDVREVQRRRAIPTPT